MKVSEFREACRHKEMIHTRLARASFRLEMAELERLWAIVSAHREGMSIREIAKPVGLSPTRVHQIVSTPNADAVEGALSVLRELGWPAPEDPSSGDEEQVADRLDEEAASLEVCARWLEELSAGRKPVVNLRPPEDWPDSDHTMVDFARLIRILRRISHDIHELARARRVADLPSSENDADPRLRHRRRLCEPPIRPEFRSNIHQARRAWEEYEQRLKQAGLPIPENPYRHFDRSLL